jgi:hypothetical protein
VDFEKIKQVLGFELTMTVPDGIGEVGDDSSAARLPTRSRRTRNTFPDRRGDQPQIPLADVRLAQDDLDAVAATCARGGSPRGRPWLHSSAVREYVGCRFAVAVSSCTSALHLAYLSAEVGRATR